MIEIRKSADRGFFDHGWLKSHHTFSFAGYRDPKFDGFRRLRVINEDIVSPGEGFGTHPHRDMEIITYVLEGKLAHRDSMGHESFIGRDEVQTMTAGSGIKHSEYNGSDKDNVHLLQIWIFPNKKNLQPAYNERKFPPSEKTNLMCPIASPDARDNSLYINQDTVVYASLLKPNSSVAHSFGDHRFGWLQVARGSVAVNGMRLEQGDGAAISDEQVVSIESDAGGEFILFDLN